MIKKKIGYIGVDKDTIYELKCKLKCITFRDIKKSKHKIFDIVLHTGSLPIEEKAMYDLFDVRLINTSCFSIDELVSLINIYRNEKRSLSSKQIKYIKVINNFQYLNEKVERIMTEEKSHSLSVAYKIKKYAESLYVSKDLLLDVYIAALMHDIGKVFIDYRILSKKSDLTNIEYQKMKTHPLKGYEMLKDYLPVLSLNMIRNHHKRENNIGYPNDNVEVLDWTRILSLCDSFDAMTSKRVYSEAKTIDEGIEELIKCTKDISDGGVGKIFNSFLTKSFINVIKLQV